MFVTQESVNAEVAYRLERALAGAGRKQAREARKQRASWVRKVWPSRTQVRRATPALP